MINFYFSNIDPRSLLGMLMSAITEVTGLAGANHPYRSNLFLETVTRSIPFFDLIVTSANRSGFYSILTALNVGADDEVIVTGFTCSAVPEPIMQRGAKPIYVDIDPETFCINPDMVEAAITPRTRAIILQHTFGFPGPIETVIDIARRHGLFVIEDCALALGCKKDGQWLGTFGDAAVWSFELSKTISVGWGGLVGINGDAAMAQSVVSIIARAGYQDRLLAAQRLFQGGLSALLYHHRTPRSLRRYGLGAFFKFRIFRSSAETPASDLRLPSDRQWKYLLRQWQRLDSILSKSKAAQHVYEKTLASHGCYPSSVRHAGSGIYLIRFPLLVEDPGRFVAFFADREIEAGRWFSSPVSSGGQSPTRYGYEWGSCPVAEQVCRHIVNLPLHGRLSPAHLESIAAALDLYLSTYPEEVVFIHRSMTPDFLRKVNETGSDQARASSRCRGTRPAS